MRAVNWVHVPHVVSGRSGLPVAGCRPVSSAMRMWPAGGCAGAVSVSVWTASFDRDGI